MNKLNILEPNENTKLGLYFSVENKTLESSLWAPTAKKVYLLIFRTANTEENPIFKIELMKNKKTGVWQKKFTKETFIKTFGDDSLIDGSFYCFSVLLPEKKEQLCLDPYSFSMAAYQNDNKFCPGAIVDLSSNNSFPDGIKTKKQLLKKCPKESVIIYEVSVRDFTIDESSATKNNKGTYKAFIEKLDYIKNLGITHIELLPVLNFYNNDETLTDFSTNFPYSNYNWGYDPHNYFTPEGWFSENPNDPYSRIRDLRELIQEAHKKNLRVILDVVYNHMASTEFLEQIVPGYYFRRNEDGSFTSASGCGNDTATENKAMRKLIIDSLTHWVKNYDVDGFRFDLMGLIDTKTIFDAIKACRRYKKDILFIGEGWKMYNGTSGQGMDQNMMNQTTDISVFNDEFRDLIKAGGMNEERKSFITDAKAENSINVEQLFYNVTGRPQQNYTVSTPLNNVQYIEAHDGLTLRDNIVFNCDINIAEETQKYELYKRIKLGNFLVLTSQGIPFIHAGQEFARTKPAIYNSTESYSTELYSGETTGEFVRNSYNSPDSVNAIKWIFTKEQHELLEYTKSLIEFRNKSKIFKLGSLEKIETNMHFQKELSNEQLLVYSIYEKNKIWFIAINSSKEKKILKLAIKRPQVYADINGANFQKIKTPEGIFFSKNFVELAPLSSFIFSENIFSEK